MVFLTIKLLNRSNLHPLLRVLSQPSESFFDRSVDTMTKSQLGSRRPGPWEEHTITVLAV